MRRQHFPPALNKVPAHVSLFHNLPGASADQILETTSACCDGYVGFDLAPLGPRCLGRGVAIAYEGAELLSLRAALAREWMAWLTPQDRQPFRPHVTIQNKVAPNVARDLTDKMRTVALPVCRVEGLTIWRYLGGPWAWIATCAFRGALNPLQKGVTTA